MEHMHCEYDCCKDDNEMYSKILQTLEDAGMLPPEKLRFCNCCDAEYIWDEEKE
jgi:hypothetical protein